MMLIEINLLPKKEPRRQGFLFVSLLVLLLAIIGGFVFYWQYTERTAQIEVLDNQIKNVKELSLIEAEKLVIKEDTDSVAELERVVKWAEEYPIETVKVMRHLSALLPDRGFIQSFAYSDGGVVTLGVQFDTSAQSAYYLNALVQSKWISDAKLLSIATEELEEEEESEEKTDLQDENKLNNDPYNPRYIGQYSLQLNPYQIKLDKEELSEEPASAEEEAAE